MPKRTFINSLRFSIIFKGFRVQNSDYSFRINKNHCTAVIILQTSHFQFQKFAFLNSSRTFSTIRKCRLLVLSCSLLFILFTTIGKNPEVKKKCFGGGKTSSRNKKEQKKWSCLEVQCNPLSWNDNMFVCIYALYV